MKQRFVPEKTVLAVSIASLFAGAALPAQAVAGVPAIGGLLAAVAPTMIDAVAGVIVGAVVLLGVSIVQRLRAKKN